MTTSIAPDDVQAGDTVEITIRKKMVKGGHSLWDEPEGYTVLGRFGRYKWGIADGDEREVVAVKVISRPEPEWGAGDVVRSSRTHGLTYVFTDGVWLEPQSGCAYSSRQMSDAWAAGRLTVLVKDRKAVTEG